MKKGIILESDKDIIINSYLKGDSLDAISRSFHVNSTRIKDVLIKNNISIRGKGIQVDKSKYCTNKKYTFDEDFFEVINNEFKAYWLGFIYADGNVYMPKPITKDGKTKGGRLDISLKAEDDYHLMNFEYDLNGNMGIKYRDMKLGDKIYPACRLTVNSIKMVNDLIKHGCVPNKSLILEFPKHLSKDMLPHFIRGYIDGDGCIFFKVYDNTSTFSVSLLGTENFLFDIKHILEGHGIICKDIVPQKSKAFCLHIYGRDNLVKLYNLLYGDAIIFLGRKIDLFRKALFYYKKDFIISEISKMVSEMDWSD